jgi:hypothetical protein
LLFEFGFQPYAEDTFDVAVTEDCSRLIRPAYFVLDLNTKRPDASKPGVVLIAALFAVLGCHTGTTTVDQSRGGLVEQGRCATQANKAAKEYETNYGLETINAENHYNPSTGVCTLLIYSLKPGIKGNLAEDEVVMDAFEGHTFGTFVAMNSRVDSCSVTLPSGEIRTCIDRQSFEKLADVYMK